MIRTQSIVLALLALTSAPALAVFKAPTPVSSFYDKSVTVVIGKVAKIDRAASRVEASVQALKGKAPADSISIGIQIPMLLDSAKTDAPLVLFLGKFAGSSALHIADGWYFPQAAGKSGFFVTKDLSANLRQSYPGTTSALVKIVEELKANNGKYSMLDEAHADMFKGGAKDLGKGEGLDLPKAAGTSVTGNFGEDPKQPMAIVIREDGIFRQGLQTTGGPGDDFTRLTGEPLSNYHKDNPKWLAGATAAALDCNGDGRMDVLINSSGGPMLLINRGFGCFFVNPDIGKTIGDALPPNAKWTALDVDGDKHDDLVVISEDGKLTAILNPPGK
jgi:FG-GAP-like repeat